MSQDRAIIEPVSNEEGRDIRFLEQKERTEYVLRARHNKREEIRNKRKILTMNSEPGLEKQSPENSANFKKKTRNIAKIEHIINDLAPKSFTMNEFSQIAKDINSKNSIQQYYGLTGISNITVNEPNSAIQAVIDADIVPRLMTLAQRDEEPYLQYEAICAITNITTGTFHQIQTIVDKDGIPILIQLLKSSQEETSRMAVSALGHIASNSRVFRDIILEYEGLEDVLNFLSNAKKELALEKGVWTLKNLCAGRLPLKSELVCKAIITLSKVIQTSQAPEMISDASWAIAHLGQRQKESNEIIIQLGIIPFLMNHPTIEQITVLTPVLSILRKVLSGSDRHASMVLETYNVVKKLFDLLDSPDISVKKEVCRLLSNTIIFTENSQLIEFVLNDPSHIQLLVSLTNYNTPELARDAVQMLSNAVIHAAPDQIARLCKNGVLDCFSQCIQYGDPQLLKIALTGFLQIMKLEESKPKEERVENKFFELLKLCNNLFKELMS